MGEVDKRGRGKSEAMDRASPRLPGSGPECNCKEEDQDAVWAGGGVLQTAAQHRRKELD